MLIFFMYIAQPGGGESVHVHIIRRDPFQSVLFYKKSKRKVIVEYFSAISTIFYPRLMLGRSRRWHSSKEGLTG